MLKQLTFVNRLALLALCFGILVSCDNTDTPEVPTLTGNSETYNLLGIADPAVTGTVTFAERSDGVTVVTIALTGTTGSGMHPTHIHANTAAEGGTIVVSLSPVSAADGSSVTEVGADDEGNALSYADLINYNGYINVHESEDNLTSLVVQGDIGQNSLTGTFAEYALIGIADPTVAGAVAFYQRKNGSSLVWIRLNGTQEGAIHPTHIHDNDAVAGGPIAISLSPVVGTTGESKTQVTAKDDGTAITYAELVSFAGYINVHLSAEELTSLVAQGNIGASAE